MIKKFFYLVILNILIFPNFLDARSAVTYTFSGGRFGDDLLAYCHAKWISYKYDIPLLYRQFPYSDQLNMHILEEPFTEIITKNYKNILNIAQTYSYRIEPDQDILYVIPYFSESVLEQDNPRFFFRFPIDWKDPNFKAELKKMISPRLPLELVKIPEGYISVALHLRIGTGYDIANIQDYYLLDDPRCQLKFSPLTYYIHQLQATCEYYKNQPLYVHVFTDHTNPKELVDILESHLKNSQITFGYRTEKNSHRLNVLEDFFSLLQFDCLIRPDAHFSFIASKLAQYQLLISPWHGDKKNNQFMIDQIDCEILGKSTILAIKE